MRLEVCALIGRGTRRGSLAFEEPPPVKLRRWWYTDFVARRIVLVALGLNDGLVSRNDSPGLPQASPDSLVFPVIASRLIGKNIQKESEANQWIHYLNKKWQRLGFGFDRQSRVSSMRRQSAFPKGMRSGLSNSATPQTERVSSLRM